MGAVAYADKRQAILGQVMWQAVTSRPKIPQSLHIVHILTRLLRSGSEENTVATCLWQAAAGHRVTLIHGRDVDPVWAPLLQGRVTLCALPEMDHPIRPRQDRVAFEALSRMLARLQPDIVHTHQSKAGFLGRFAAPRGALVVHGIHILPFEGVGRITRALYLFAERLAARRTDLFIGVSPTVSRTYVRLGISTQRQTEVVLSGMPLDRFRSAALPLDAADLIGADPQGPDRPAVIVMLAALEPRKRHAAFLQALARNRAALPACRILLAGSGPEEASLRDLVTASGLQDIVTFCGHRSDPEALIALSDLTVLTSAREGLPRVVVQSLAGGRPVVVSRMAGIADIVEDGVNGVITDAVDLDQTVLQIAHLLTNPDALARLAQGAAATETGQWACDFLGADTTALYRRALRARAVA